MMLRACFAAFAASVFGLASAQNIPLEKYRLPNGMVVILAPDHSLPMATINTWFSVGSKDEPPRRSGFAHLFEHLMFMGTERVKGHGFDEIMEGQGGSNNATTAEDRTNYYSSGPANLLPTLLWLDADRLEGLSKAMTQEKLDLQRQVVKNERRESTENTPYGKAYEAINGLMFPEGHPYHTSVIGSHEDLEAATVKDVTDFFDTFYVPNNASLVVAGDFDPKTVKPIIAKYFGTLPRRNDPARRSVPPVSFAGERKVTMVDQVQFAKLINVYHSPAAYQPGDIEMRLASQVLSSGLTSRLYDRLVVKDKLATDVSTFQEPRRLGSLFYVDATASENASLDKLQAAIDQEVARFTTSGPTLAELERNKAQAQFALLNRLQSVGEKADMLNEFQFYLGDPNALKRVVDRYAGATPEAVRLAAKRVLDPHRRLALRVVPESTPPAQNPRDAQPQASAGKPFSPPAPESFRLANGMQVFYWHRPQLPLMSIATLFPAGADIDPAAKAGRTDLAASMLAEGAGSRNARQFQEALDQLGANFSAGASHNATTTALSVTSANFGKALGLYADALRSPRFDEAEWQRVKRTTVANLTQQLDDPGTVARQVSMREYFGATHPYGRQTSGTPSTVARLGLEDLKKAYKAVFLPKQAVFFVAGSLTASEVRKALDSAFGSWKATAAPTTKVAYPTVKHDRLRLVVVDKPGAVQTVIRFVLPGAPYRDPNRLTYGALGTILGGSFTSRLNQDLREEKGYTYGAGAGFNFEREFGTFTASAAVRADVTGASLDEFFKILSAIRKGDVTAEEAKKAALIQQTGIVESMGNLDSILATAMAMHLQGKAFSELGKDLAGISAVDAEKINLLAGPGIDLEHGVLVLVGDRATILKQLEGKGLPTPEFVKP
ncbi:MAG: pitrilysin family protein [Fimbriimonadales bacterium]